MTGRRNDAFPEKPVTMKTKLKSVLTAKVHCLLFVLACAVLAGVVLRARVMTDGISADILAAINQFSLPGSPIIDD
jgi:hypothetical protein